MHVKRRAKNGVVVRGEIRRYQNSTELLVPKAPISCLIREVARKVAPENLKAGLKFTDSAIEALRQASEAYLVGTFINTDLAAMHAKRITIMAKDIHLTCRLQGIQRSYHGCLHNNIRILFCTII
jgi:histone H3/H4